MRQQGDWELVRDLFHAGLDVPPGERRAFVMRRADNPSIVEEVMSLLDAHPAADGFLSQPPGFRDLATAVVLLRQGDRIGAFEIVGLIGAGGMGEVYRARDVRLDRDVAIKVLSCHVGDDPGARERLEREARAIARLTHPRISTLHDVGSARIGDADATYLVMELVDGETVAARLRRGPMTIAEALPVAIDVAEALVAAHAAGLVHRDLKPANVMLTRTGAKLLDFGLARPRSSPAPHDPHISTSTLSATMSSVVAGTPAYMAPEQLKGGSADARSDLFAFGAMLYEMIAGRRAFDAASPGDLAAAILEREPAPLSAHVPLVPPVLDRLVVTCLAKDPDERWQTARDLLRELRWLRDDSATRRATRVVATTTPRRGFAIAALVVAAAAIGAFGLVTLTRKAPPTPSRVDFQIDPPPGTRFPRGSIEMAVSPDGSRLVFTALSADGRRKLWLRRFDAVDSRPIDGSEEGMYPFWAPDSRTIAFFAHSKLKRIAETGGVPQDICDMTYGPRGGAWSRAGIILFGVGGHPLMRVADTGGVATPITRLNESRADRQHTWPVLLPDGRNFLYLAQSVNPDETAIFQGSIEGDTRRLLAADAPVGVTGEYLFTLSKGLLSARTYDATGTLVLGAPTTIAERLVYDPPQRSGPAFSVGADVVAFRSASPDSSLHWVDRRGRTLDTFPERADFHHPWFSPDEQQLAVEKTDPATGRHSIWILNPSRGTSSRLLLEPSGAHVPMWSPDGTRIAFGSSRAGSVDLYDIAADGSGGERLLLDSKAGTVHITDWSLDGRFILYDTDRRGQRDLRVLPLSPKGDARPYLETGADERQGQFSPDVHWVAYSSDESGASEVYVRKFPDTGGKWQVSTRGGAQPRWRRDGRELFYLAADGKLMAAAVTAGPAGLSIAPPRDLFDTGIRASFVERRNQFLVTRDGQRFLVNISDEDEASAPITVVMHWNAARR
jgi:serine/threonine protein kinase/Tol biopolymer transport system component